MGGKVCSTACFRGSEVLLRTYYLLRQFQRQAFLRLLRGSGVRSEERRDDRRKAHLSGAAFGHSQLLIDIRDLILRYCSLPGPPRHSCILHIAQPILSRKPITWRRLAFVLSFHLANTRISLRMPINPMRGWKYKKPLLHRAWCYSLLLKFQDRIWL